MQVLERCDDESRAAVSEAFQRLDPDSDPDAVCALLPEELRKVFRALLGVVRERPE